MSEAKQPIRLLLVDDEKQFLEATSRALTRRGFAVTSVQNPRLVPGLLEDSTFDVAVLDVKMPGMTGDELFGMIKERRPGLPVIMLTGHGSVQQAFRVSRQGVFDYLTKPCDVEDLADLARRAVEQAGPALEPGADPMTGSPIQLLLVDDERDLLWSLAPALRRRGIQVTTASREREALQELDARPFQVAVVDVHLPGEDGIRLFQRIKAIQPLCEVILFTGQPSVDAAVQATREGAFDYLVKPSDTETLAAKIRAAHRRHLTQAARDRERTVDDILERYPD